MKPSVFRIERILEKLETPPERKVLRVIIDGDDEVAKGEEGAGRWPSM